MYRPLYSLMAALSLTASLGACADEPTPLTAPTRGPIPVGPGLSVSLGPISADPAPLTFPATVWHQPRLDTLTVTNSGSNVATIGNVSVSGPNAFDFELAVINGDTPDCGGRSSQARSASSACTSAPGRWAARGLARHPRFRRRRPLGRPVRRGNPRRSSLRARLDVVCRPDRGHHELGADGHDSQHRHVRHVAVRDCAPGLEPGRLRGDSGVDQPVRQGRAAQGGTPAG